MARRMYDLDNGTDDIVVKGVKVVGINGLVIIKDNDAITNYPILIESTDTGASVSAGDLIVFTLDVVGQATRVSLPLRITRHTSPNRPSTPDDGTIIYDLTLQKCILYNGTAWVNLDGTALS